MAVIVGVSEDLTAPAALYLEAVAVSVLVFWSTHVYAEALIGRLRDPQGGWRRLARESAKHEMPLLEAAAPPALALALGVLGAVPRHVAVGLALGLGVAELFGWGVAVGRRLGQNWPRAVSSGLVNAALGGALVGLKALTAH